MTRNLIIRADDLGSFPGVAEAAIDAVRAGGATLVTVMAPTPWAAEACALLRANSDIPAALHLTFNSEGYLRFSPLRPGRSIVDAQGWLHKSFGHYQQHGMDAAEVLRECDAQLEFVHRRGLRPAMVDTHMAIEWHKDLDGVHLGVHLKAWCQRRGVPWYQEVATRTGPAENTPPRAWAATLAGLSPGTWLVNAHPARPSHQLNASGWSSRVDSANWLRSRVVADAATALGYRLVSRP